MDLANFGGLKMTQICQDLMDFIKFNICSDPLLFFIGVIILVAGIITIVAGIVWLINHYLLMWLAPLGQTIPLAIILVFYKQLNLGILLSFSSMIISYLILAVVVHVQLRETEASNDTSRSNVITIQILGFIGLLLWFFVFYNLSEVYIQEQPQPYVNRGQ